MLPMAWLPACVGLQVILLALACLISNEVVAAVCLAASTLFTTLLLKQLFHHQRAILDTPTSRVSSAAQGYVELMGKAQRAGAQPLRSRLTNLPCVWYRYRVEQRRNENWWHIDSGQSSARLRLRDDSGECLIDPQGAEVIARRVDRWSKDDYRFQEELLLEGETLYALGQLGTEGGVGDLPTRGAILHEVLNRWKRDQPALLARFDLDRNGHLDEQEWEQARRAAAREASAQDDNLRTGAARSVLHRDTRGRPFLISNYPPEGLARRYVVWFRLHALLLALNGVAWMFWLHDMGIQ